MRLIDNSINIKSLHDKDGIVFEKDGRIFRAIAPDKIQFIRELLESSFFRNLIEDGYFPETWIADTTVEGYEFVLEHQKKFCIHPLFWSYSRLLDATIFILKISNLSEEAGYYLWDGKWFNMGFDNCTPFVFDLGAFEPTRDDNNKINSYFINFYPLLLCYLGEEQLARFSISLKNAGYIDSFPTIFISRYLVTIYLSNLILCKNNKFLALCLTTLHLPSFLFGKKYRHYKFTQLKTKILCPEYLDTKLRIVNVKEEQALYKKMLDDIDRFGKAYELILEKMKALHTESIAVWADNPSFPLFLDKTELCNITKLYFNHDTNKVDLAYRVLKSHHNNVDAYLANLYELPHNISLQIKVDCIVFLDGLDRFCRGWLRLEGFFQMLARYAEKLIVFNYIPSNDIFDRTQYIQNIAVSMFTSVTVIEDNGVIYFFAEA